MSELLSPNDHDAITEQIYSIFEKYGLIDDPDSDTTWDTLSEFVGELASTLKEQS